MNTRIDHRDLRASAVQSYSWFEKSDDVEIERPATLSYLLSGKCEWNPHFGRLGKIETGMRKLECRRHQPDDRVRLIIEANASTDDVRCLTKSLFPEAITDYDNVIFVG